MRFQTGGSEDEQEKEIFEPEMETKTFSAEWTMEWSVETINPIKSRCNIDAEGNILLVKAKGWKSSRNLNEFLG